jgi:hypothetical protein
MSKKRYKPEQWGPLVPVVVEALVAGSIKVLSRVHQVI